MNGSYSNILDDSESEEKQQGNPQNVKIHENPKDTCKVATCPKCGMILYRTTLFFCVPSVNFHQYHSIQPAISPRLNRPPSVATCFARSLPVMVPWTALWLIGKNAMILLPKQCARSKNRCFTIQFQNTGQQN